MAPFPYGKGDFGVVTPVKVCTVICGLTDTDAAAAPPATCQWLTGYGIWPWFKCVALRYVDKRMFISYQNQWIVPNIVVMIVYLADLCDLVLNYFVVCRLI